MNTNFRAIFCCLSACLVLATVAKADDTEIYFSQHLSSEQAASNIFMMFDISGSMREDIDSTTTRLNSVKKAMVDVIDSGTNVRLGVGAFNGLGQGGSVHVPMVSPDEDRCPNATCGIVQVRGLIHSAEDDARQKGTGEMVLDETTLTLGVESDADTVTTQWYSEVVGDNDALEYEDGTFDLNGAAIRMFGDDENNVPTVGLRFPNVTIPPDAEIIFADIALYSSGPDNNEGKMGATVYIDSTTDSPPFADVAGQRVLDRPVLGEDVDWQDIYARDTLGDARYSVDLTKLIEKRIEEPDWESGDAMTLILEARDPGDVAVDKQLSYLSYDAGGTTRLKVEFSSSALSSQTIGLRYSDLNIPRGATITGAKIEFVSAETAANEAILNISAEDSGDAAAFSGASGDLSSRARTSGIDWTPDDWSQRKRPYESIDISSVVQSVVNRSDWCGGNAMALFVTGSGKHDFYTHDHNQFYAPMLKVSYDASSVTYGSSCSRKREVTNLSSNLDDAVENLAGAMTVDGATLATHDGSSGNLIGLRFTNVGVPSDASVSSAYLRMSSAGTTGERPSVAISGELAAYSAVFDNSLANNLSSRARTVATASWADIADEESGNTIQSVDIGNVVGEIVNQAGWISGNPITLLLAGDSVDSGLREFISNDDGGKISLVVNYAVDGADFTADNIALITDRENLVNSILDLRPMSSTPLVDAYYEAAAYMTGAAVDFGKTRGGGSVDEVRFRVSAPDTYTNGNVVRSPGCTDSDMNDTSCADEHIVGQPVYTQIDPGECQANQIVLLTDGAATSFSSEARIKSLTGDTSCATRSNGDELCGLELSTWLSNNDHFSAISGTQSVITHTVGFSFSSSFLEELAIAGGGGFYNANSSAELVDAFTKIVQSAADSNASFVAPSTSISQTNRLTNSNHLYFALFNPSANIKWDGNVKKYSLGADTTDPSKIIIVDSDGDPAFDESAGVILDTAKSHWSATADGPDVALGGAASKISIPRKVLTYIDKNATPEPLIDLVETDTTLTSGLFNIGAGMDDYRNDVIKWARGVDIKDFDGDGDTSEVRTQMGDPLHSSPVIIDYATKSVLFVGTNESFLHAIDTSDGTEEFAFIPKDLLSNLPDYFENPSDRNRPYGLDGDITSWTEDSNHNNKVDSGESAYIVFGMRRGGRNYYALDVSNPSAPKLKWVIEGGYGDFTELGQTWSKPIKTRIRTGATEKDVLIFSAGYDPANDSKLVRDANDTMGRGLFIVEADTGDRLAYEAPITNTDLQYAIPSNIRAVDINLDSFVDYLFVGDAGGQLWRFDIDNYSTGSLDTALTGGVIADLGGSDGENFRRFFYEPDVALINGGAMGSFLNISIGSGFRAHPLQKTTKDRMYVLRDRDVFSAPVDDDGDVTYTKLTESDLFDATSASGSTDTSNKISDGWYVTLSDPGEKILSRAVTINGQVLFTSYLPHTGTSGPCGVAVGQGRVYVVDAKYADPVSDLDDSGDTTLTLTDRYKNLVTEGIPPNVSALIPEVSPDAPIVVVGPEVLPEIDFGELFKRTYWAEQ